MTHALLRRAPPDHRTEAAWRSLATALRDALAGHLGVRLEFVGDRRPRGDMFSPLVRSVGDALPALNLRVAGILSCVARPEGSGVHVEALLFAFSDGQRFAPPGAQFALYEHLEDAWTWRGWQTSDFPDEWDGYTFERFFGGLEAELPGCGHDDA